MNYGGIVLDKINDKISIIVPIYNVEEYVEKCIKSLINQTYKNIEIILVDDGSTDSSYDICKKYSETDSRINLIHKENGGLSDARNVGIENATGEYITFLDSDDWLSYNYCETMIKEINETKADIVMCNLVNVYNDDYVFKNKSDYNKDIYSNIQALEKFEDTINVVAVAKLYKKNLFDNLRYKVGKIHEDEFMFHRIFFKANKIVCLDIQMYAYRQRQNSITTSRFSLKRLDIIDALEDRINFYEENSLEKLKEKTRAAYMYLLKKNIKEVSNSDFDNKDEYIKKMSVRLKRNYKECKKTKYISYKFFILSKIMAHFNNVFNYYIYK